MILKLSCARYELLTPSARIRRERVVLIRSAFDARYSSQSYQRCACSTLGKLQHHQPLGRPATLEGLGGAAPNDVAAAVLLDGWRHEVTVLLEAGRIGDVDLGNDVRRHRLSLRGDIVQSL